jgi:hypothetical protein
MIVPLLAMQKIKWLGFIVLVVAILAWFIDWIKNKIG